MPWITMGWLVLPGAEHCQVPRHPREQLAAAVAPEAVSVTLASESVRWCVYGR